MNELQIDYTNKEKLSTKRKRTMIIAGSIFIGLSLILLITSFFEEFRISILLSSICNIALGTIFLLQGMEHKILHPKKYIRISADGIEYKLGRSYSYVNISWDSLQSIEINTKSIRFTEKEKTTSLKMIHFPSKDEKKIKILLSTIGQAKNLISTT